MRCKICEAEVEKFTSARVLGKYDAVYVKCKTCGFLFAEDPFWLKEAYDSAITSTDIGTVYRTDHNSRRVKVLIDVFFRSANRFLDFGAGYGMFVRRMRDIGYNFLAFDPHCDNIFAQQHKLESLDGVGFDLATAFEVFEHLEDPNAVFKLLLSKSDSLLFTTELLPVPTPTPGDWWYYGLDHGQHISFYSVSALKVAAERNGAALYTNGSDLHLISRKRISSSLFRQITRDWIARAFSLLAQRQSLLPGDFDAVRRASGRIPESKIYNS